ncbi:MAG TPA: hypothetical protein VH333_10270 [Pseudonocardiaceae bacterium]|jgi:hypothetical protein|nr:hypothetical protein [Pseudonocardiaceae bacterium]
MVGAIVLACGRGGRVAGSPMLTGRVGVKVHTLPERPDRDTVDPLLAEVGIDGEFDRAVVVGDDGDLAAVVLRLLRTERLGEVAIGYAPVIDDSEVSLTWDLPADLGRALDVALGGTPDRVPLIRDDKGGVLIGLGTIGPLRGVAYCDDTQVLRGPAKTIRVVPASNGIEVAVAHRGLFNRRQRSTTGRAFEVGCLPTKVVRDGVAYERPVKTWRWYRHTEDLRLVRGVA